MGRRVRRSSQQFFPTATGTSAAGVGQERDANPVAIWRSSTSVPFVVIVGTVNTGSYPITLSALIPSCYYSAMQ